jgi:hypothetical protein
VKIQPSLGAFLKLVALAALKIHSCITTTFYAAASPELGFSLEIYKSVTSELLHLKRTTPFISEKSAVPCWPRQEISLARTAHTKHPSPCDSFGFDPNLWHTHNTKRGCFVCHDYMTRVTAAAPRNR